MNEAEYRNLLFKNNWNLKVSRPLISSVYPSISKIIVNLNFSYNGAIKHTNSYERIYYPHDNDYFKIECINPECLDTDLDISNDIKNMVAKKSNIYEGQMLCNGFQDYERSKTNHNKCLAEMKYKIEIEYK